MSLNSFLHISSYYIPNPSSDPAERRRRLECLLHGDIGPPPGAAAPPPPAPESFQYLADDAKRISQGSYLCASERVVAWVQDRCERNERYCDQRARLVTHPWLMNSHDVFEQSPVDPSDTESIMEQTEPLALVVARKVYSPDLLIQLHGSLPLLKCDLKRFSADAWRAQILVPPGKKHCASETYFPADFPATSTRKLSEIPDHRLLASRVHQCLGSSEGGTEDEFGFKGPSKKKQRESSSLSMMSSNATGAPPHRQPLAPPKGLLPQQDVGFARFLKEVASPTHKRVTAGGRIVSAEYPPRLYGRNKKSSETSWARVPYSHITNEMPQNTNDTFLAFPNGSFYWGPQGELYVRPAPEVLFSAMYPGQQPPNISVPVTDTQAYHMSGPGNESGVQMPLGFNAGTQLPGQQVPMTLPSMPVNNMLGVPLQPGQFQIDPMTGGPVYNNPFPWTYAADGTQQADDGMNRNIRTPRVHFPIGSRFDYEQNQQALRDRLAQLVYEIDNLHYLSPEEAELKRLEKKLVEEQIEQFRQVWELQTYLAGGDQMPANQAQTQVQVPMQAEAQPQAINGGESSSAAGTRRSSRAKRSSQRSENNTALLSREPAAPTDGSPTIARSTAPEVKAVERKARTKKVSVNDPATPQKPQPDFVVQTPPSMAPIQGKENRSSSSTTHSTSAVAPTMPTIPGPDQVPVRYNAAGASLRSQLLRKNAAPSIESLHISIDIDGVSSKAAGAPVTNPDSDGLHVDGDATPTPPKKTKQQMQRSTEELRLSAGMPTDADEVSKVPVKKFAFAQQLRKIASASKLFFGENSQKSLDAPAATNDDSAPQTKPVATGKTSPLRNSAILEARDINGVTIIAPVLPQIDGLSATVSNNNKGPLHKVYDRTHSKAPASFRPSSAVESLRKIYQQDTQSAHTDNKANQRQRKKQPAKMEASKNDATTKGNQVANEQHEEAAKQNETIQKVLGVINDPSNQSAFLARMLKNRRYAGVGFDPEQFDKLVQAEMRKHQVRLKDVASPSEVDEHSKAPGKIALGMPLVSVKAPPSPPLPTATNAQGVLQRPGQASSKVSSSAKPAVQKKDDTKAGQAVAGSAAAPAVTHPHPLRPSRARATNKEQAHRNEVSAFFAQLERDEEAEIARYKAENPL